MSEPNFYSDEDEDALVAYIASLADEEDPAAAAFASVLTYGQLEDAGDEVLEIVLPCVILVSEGDTFEKQSKTAGVQTQNGDANWTVFVFAESLRSSREARRNAMRLSDRLRDWLLGWEGLGEGFPIYWLGKQLSQLPAAADDSSRSGYQCRFGREVEIRTQI